MSEAYRQRLIDILVKRGVIAPASGPRADDTEYFWVTDDTCLSSGDLKIIAEEIAKRNKNKYDEVHGRCNHCVHCKIVEDRNSEYHPFGICEFNHDVDTRGVMEFYRTDALCTDFRHGEPEYA
jgi:hypothetical protein